MQDWSTPKGHYLQAYYLTLRAIICRIGPHLRPIIELFAGFCRGPNPTKVRNPIFRGPNSDFGLETKFDRRRRVRIRTLGRRKKILATKRVRNPIKARFFRGGTFLKVLDFYLCFLFIFLGFLYVQFKPEVHFSSFGLSTVRKNSERMKVRKYSKRIPHPSLQHESHEKSEFGFRTFNGIRPRKIPANNGPKLTPKLNPKLNPRPG